jgi:hypothetical protein
LHLQSVTAAVPVTIVDEFPGHVDGAVTVCDDPATAPVHTPPGKVGKMELHAACEVGATRAINTVVNTKIALGAITAAPLPSGFYRTHQAKTPGHPRHVMLIMC